MNISSCQHKSIPDSNRGLSAPGWLCSIGKCMYTKNKLISFTGDLTKYSDAKSKVAAEMVKFETQLENADDSKPLWKQLGRGRYHKNFFSFTREPSTRVMRGARKSKFGNGKLGVKAFFFDVDAKDKTKAFTLENTELKVIENAISKIPQIKTKQGVIENISFVRSSSKKGIQIQGILPNEVWIDADEGKTTKNKIQSILKNHLDEIFEFIGEFEWDDCANAGLAKLWFSDGQEKPRVVALDENKTMIDTTIANEKENGTQSDCGNEIFGTVMNESILTAICENKGIEMSKMKIEKTNDRGWKTMKVVIGSKMGKRGYQVEVACVVGNRPSDSFFELDKSKEIGIAGTLLSIYQKRSSHLNLNKGVLPIQIENHLNKRIDEDANVLTDKNKLSGLTKELLSILQVCTRGSKRYIEYSKKMIEILNERFNLKIKFDKIKNKVKMIDDVVNGISQFIPSFKITFISFFSTLKTIQQAPSLLYTGDRVQETKPKKESHDFLPLNPNPRNERDYFTQKTKRPPKKEASEADKAFREREAREFFEQHGW